MHATPTSMPNPYAPPAVTPLPGSAPAPVPLPAGFQRYRLDPPRYRAFLSKIMRRRKMIIVGIAGTYIALLLAIDIFDPSTTFLICAFFAFLVIVGLVRLRFLERRTSTRVLESYELLASPRALRRVTLVAPSEIFLPEVSSIVELKTGLSLGTENPKNRFFIPMSLDGYAQLRERLAALRPIETLRGFAGFRRQLSHFRSEHQVSVASREASLGEEMAILRAASISVPHAYMMRPRIWRIVLLWVLLVVLFVAVWQLLAPPPERSAPTRKPAPTMQEQVGEDEK